MKTTHYSSLTALALLLLLALLNQEETTPKTTLELAEQRWLMCVYKVEGLVEPDPEWMRKWKQKTTLGGGGGGVGAGGVLSFDDDPVLPPVYCSEVTERVLELLVEDSGQGSYDIRISKVFCDSRYLIVMAPSSFHKKLVPYLDSLQQRAQKRRLKGASQ